MGFNYPEDMLLVSTPKSGAKTSFIMSEIAKWYKDKQWKLITIDEMSGQSQFFSVESGEAYEKEIAAILEEQKQFEKAAKVLVFGMLYGVSPMKYSKTLLNKSPEDKYMEAVAVAIDKPKTKNQERREHLAKLPQNRRKMRY